VPAEKPKIFWGFAMFPGAVEEGMRLRLSEWAHIAEIVGAAAAVASLVFVGFQLRENTREVRAATFQAVADTDLSLLQDLARSKELATTCLRNFENIHGLRREFDQRIDGPGNVWGASTTRSMFA
jgi:hypothetical protein